MISDEELLSDEKSFVEKISSCYQDEASSDIRLIVGKNSYLAHKFVLSASSDVFARMVDRKWLECSMKTLKNGKLTKSEFKKNQTDSDEPNTVLPIELEEHEECVRAFPEFLRYFYTGRVRINSSHVVGLLCLADKYDVESLRALVCSYMEHHCASPKVGNALRWYSWLKLLSLHDIEKRCWITICNSFQQLMVSKELWLSLDVCLLQEVLRSSSLIVDNEYSIYQALREWLTNRTTQQQGDGESALKVMELVRFSQMTPRQLCDIEYNCQNADGCDSQTEELFGLVRGFVTKAHRYRSMCLYLLPDSQEFSTDWYQPRHYLELKVDRINLAVFNRYSSIAERKSLRTPFISSDQMDWKINYRKVANKWSATIRCVDNSGLSSQVRVQFVLISVNSRDEVIDQTWSGVVKCYAATQETLDSEQALNGHPVAGLIVLVKVMIQPAN